MPGFLQRYIGYRAVILSACFFALISQLTKLAYSYGMTPLQLLTLQSGIAAMLLVVYALLFRPQVLRIPSGFMPKLLAHSLIGSLGTNVLYALTLLYLPASLGTMLFFTYPMLVTLGAVTFFGQKIKMTQALALGLAVTGIVLSTQFWQVTGGSLELKGILLGLGSAAAYAFFILYGEHILATMQPLTSLTYVQAISAIGLIFYQLPSYTAGQAVLFNGTKQLFIGISLATLASIIPFWLLLAGIKHIGASKASIIGTLELPVVIVMSHLFLHEQLSGWQVAGAILILCSILTVRMVDN